MPRPTRNSKKRTRPEVFLAQLRKKLRVEPLEAIELRAIRHALRVTRDDKLLAAALLGIGKTTLYRRLKDL
jgi:transcriptional regulator with PAS, ATPase and Fis domain